MKKILKYDKKIFTYLIYLVNLSFITSCNSSRNLVYFSDLKDSAEYKTAIINSNETRIQPDDLLSITVSTLNPESNALFNNGVLQTVDGTNSPKTATTANEGYLVDKSGFVNFPVVGRIKLGGLTKEEARDRILNELKKYIKGNAIVNIRFLNFRVTVIGEVNRPSTINVPGDKINILEALGLAGDMTAFGKRENVLIIREKNNSRNITRIDLTNKEALNSPYFYLQQNDIVYVEPDKVKAMQVSSNTFYLTRTLAIASVVALIISRLLL